MKNIIRNIRHQLTCVQEVGTIRWHLYNWKETIVEYTIIGASVALLIFVLLAPLFVV